MQLLFRFLVIVCIWSCIWWLQNNVWLCDSKHKNDAVIGGYGVAQPVSCCFSSCVQDDEVVLQCSATIHREQQKLCLAAEGFGNRLCFLESISNSKVTELRNIYVLNKQTWGKSPSNEWRTAHFIKAHSIIVMTCTPGLIITFITASVLCQTPEDIP